MKAGAQVAVNEGADSGLAEAQPGGRLSDLAYARILENLFDRRLPAGAFVSQNDLVKLLGIPVAPLRDALRTLEVEGILTIHPRSGIQFVKPGLELTKSTYQFRTIIERAAVRTFAELGDEDLIRELGDRHRAVSRHIETSGLTAGTMEELEVLESLLHNSIIAILRNALIETSYRRMHTYLRLVRLDRKLTVCLATPHPGPLPRGARGRTLRRPCHTAPSPLWGEGWGEGRQARQAEQVAELGLGHHHAGFQGAVVHRLAEAAVPFVVVADVRHFHR
jgi:DNA-binding GntR family transcriptional regulator